LPPTVLIEIDKDGKWMGQVLYVTLLHLWAGTEGKRDEELVWTKMFLSLGGC